jgi:hypothetical protein
MGKQDHKMTTPEKLPLIHYAPFIGVMPDGTQILVQIFVDQESEGLIDSVQVTFRDDPFETWSPPIRTKKA